MSALEDLQASGQSVRDLLDSATAAITELEKNTDEIGQQFGVLGQDATAQLLSGSANAHLTTARELFIAAQEELDAYVAECDQARG